MQLQQEMREPFIGGLPAKTGDLSDKALLTFAVKGLAVPVSAWQVLQPSAVVSQGSICSPNSGAKTKRPHMP